MSIRFTFIASLFLGALSWAICPFFSGEFEPFDSGIGLVVGQLAMLIFMVCLGWSTNFKHLFVGVLGLYISQNIYAYIMGSSETRVWAVLLLLTSLALCMLPFLGGLLSRLIKIGYVRYRKNG